MREDAAAELVCPKTGAPLRLEVAERDQSHVVTGRLVSTVDASIAYPVERGVPRFLDVSALADSEQRSTVDAFSYKWSKIPGWAATDRTKRNRERWYFERFGFDAGDRELREFLADRERVLEAGTGAGTDTDLLARNASGRVFGVDLSDAIDVAYERFKDRANVLLAQADLGELPFRPDFFDVISCDQVLHHTPDPRSYFSRLVDHLRPGGRLLLYVYRVKAPLRELADDHLRATLTRAPLDEVLAFCRRVTKLGRELSGLGARVTIDEDIPELGITAGTYDLQRLVYYHVVKCFWNDDYDFDTNVMINFDWYRPAHAFRYKPEDVRRWCDEEGLAVERLHVCASGISLIARK